MVSKYQYVMSKDIHRKKQYQEMFLDWINSRSEFNCRRPTVDETVDEMTRGCLRPLVEQNVRKAAYKYWYDEAQYYLRHVQIVKVDVISKEATPPIKAFIPIRTTSMSERIPDSDYIPSRRIANNPSIARVVMQDALREIDNWVARYEGYAEFFTVFDEMISVYKQTRDKVAARIRQVRKSG